MIVMQIQSLGVFCSSFAWIRRDLWTLPPLVCVKSDEIQDDSDANPEPRGVLFKFCLD